MKICECGCKTLTKIKKEVIESIVQVIPHLIYNYLPKTIQSETIYVCTKCRKPLFDESGNPIVDELHLLEWANERKEAKNE